VDPRIVDAGPEAGRPMATVAHVASAVDDGRDRAAAAAAAGVTLLVVTGPADPVATDRVLGWLGGERGTIRGPLGALWRLGDEALAVLCGVALGAGEQGLALLADGAAGTAATGLALAVQPGLRPRVRLAGPPSDAGRALDLPSVLAAGEGLGAEAAVAALRRACAGG